MQRYAVYFIWKLLYMFRVVPPPIIRSAYTCIYNIWYLSHRYCYLPLWRQVAVTVWQIPNAVDTVVCASDDGWWYHRKHVEQFPDKINCVTLHLVEYTFEYRLTYFSKCSSMRFSPVSMENHGKFKLLRVAPRDGSNERNCSLCLFGIFVSNVAGKFYLQITQ
jgi:hypothetical protein